MAGRSLAVLVALNQGPSAGMTVRGIAVSKGIDVFCCTTLRDALRAFGVVPLEWVYEGPHQQPQDKTEDWRDDQEKSLSEILGEMKEKGVKNIQPRSRRLGNWNRWDAVITDLQLDGPYPTTDMRAQYPIPAALILASAWSHRVRPEGVAAGPCIIAMPGWNIPGIIKTFAEVTPQVALGEESEWQKNFDLLLGLVQ